MILSFKWNSKLKIFYHYFEVLRGYSEFFIWRAWGARSKLVEIILTHDWSQWWLLCHRFRPGPPVLADIRDRPGDLLPQEVLRAEGSSGLDAEQVKVRGGWGQFSPRGSGPDTAQAEWRNLIGHAIKYSSPSNIEFMAKWWLPCNGKDLS